MLVSSIPGINEPSDETTVWQYMDFAKLISMLDRGELFFVRIDKVDDPYEGTVPEFNLRERMPTSRAQYPDITEERHQKAFDDIDNHVAELIRHGKVLINCWHMNEFESAAMWDLYAKSGIAIKTTFKRLKDSLDKGTPELIKFGLVGYTDFKSEWMAEDNLYHRFFLKRKSFEHEKELRAVLQLELEGLTEKVKDRGERARWSHRRRSGTPVVASCATHASRRPTRRAARQATTTYRPGRARRRRPSPRR